MYVVFDIGGTKTRVAVSHDLVSFETPVKFETSPDFEKGIAGFIEAIRLATGDTPITALCGGIRGPLNAEKTSIVSETVLADWVGKPIVERLRSEFGVSVQLENDTALAALGEARFGAGKGYSIVAYHTVSTGVGGARVVDCEIDVASSGFEPGHQGLDIDRSIFGVDIPHTLQNLVSGTALESRRGVKPYEIPQTDPVWDELAGYLAEGLRNTILYWSPNVVVLGGSMIVGDPRIPLPAIASKTTKLLGDLMPPPPIVDACLGDGGGLYGGMALLAQNLKIKK